MNDIFRGLIDVQAEKLLAGYRQEDSFFFASPERTLLTQGHYADIESVADLAQMGERVREALGKARQQGHPYPIAVGCIPFDINLPAALSIPHQVMMAGPLSSLPAMPTHTSGVCRVNPVPSPQGYASAVAQAVARIRAGALDKVVLARTLEIEAEQPIDLPTLLARLARRNTQGYTFAVRLRKDEGTLIGASPELLLSRYGYQVRSNPLAGSAARVSDTLEDARRSRALLESDKDLHEHQVVAQAVEQGLRPFCRTLDAPEGPSLLSTATMWHLSSDIRGELLHHATHGLALAGALHPTPAVCGHPLAAARELIAELEPFARGYYTGMVGWCDEDGNGEWAVTLRCAQVHDRHVRLYAGAGIVADSDPASELAETEAKFRTMLQALGLAQSEGQ